MNIATMSAEDAKYIFNFLRSGNYWSNKWPRAIEESVGEQDAQTLMSMRQPSITFAWARRDNRWILTPQDTGGNILTETKWYQIVKEIDKFYSSSKKGAGRPRSLPTKSNVVFYEGIEKTVDGWSVVCPVCNWMGKSPYKTEKRAKQALGGHKSFCPTLSRIVDTLATDIDVEPSLYEKESMSGYVYLMGGGGYFKIGLSIDPEARLTQIEPVMPYDIELIHTIPTNDRFNAEKYLHKRFVGKRTKGEWFDLSEEDVAWIKGLKELMYA